jgi:prepilin signal peptidase PulO-like enzyme (type II secretory pathway)
MAPAAVIAATYLSVVGAAMGSFTDAAAWRLRTGGNLASGRSECESCRHRLSGRDLVPVVSWLLLRGSCRYCKARISPLAPVVEATLAGLFVLSFAAWPLGFGDPRGIASFVLWLAYLVAMAVLVQYDLRWMILPDRVLLPLVPLVLTDAGLRVSLAGGAVAAFASHVLLGSLAFGGLYAALHILSTGQWVGLGDAKLCLLLGVVLGWRPALLALAAANLAAAAYVLPGLLAGRRARTDRLPLSPFLAAGFVVAGLAGERILDWLGGVALLGG